MIKSFNGKTPRIAESAFISEAAYVIGDVEIGENSSVWPGAVIRADFDSIKIGSYCAVEDCAVIHSGSPNSPVGDVIIGDKVHIGHGAVLNCRKIGNKVLIGMNATVLHDAEIGNGCIIAAGSLIEQGAKIPDNSFVAGVPGKIMGKPAEKHLRWVNVAPERYAGLAKQYKDQGF